MNISKIINAKDVNMDISKQKQKNVFYVVQKKMEVMLVVNALMKKMNKVPKPKILFAKDVIPQIHYLGDLSLNKIKFF